MSESDIRGGVDSSVSRRTLWNTGPIVDDIFVTARLPVLVQLLSLLTLVVELLDLKTYKTHVFTLAYVVYCVYICAKYYTS